MITQVDIPVDKGHLAADLYEPETPNGLAVVLAHGFSLTRGDGLGGYARAFADAGATAVTFDYRGFGDSPGPPQDFNAKRQQEDWNAALDYAKTLQPKVVPWSFSFGAGHVITLAAHRTDLAAAIVLCPFLDGLHRALATPPRTTAWILPKAVASAAGRRVTIPVTARPGEQGAMNLAGEYDGFHAVVDEKSLWRNEITPAVFLTVATFRPVTKAAKVTVPLWVGRGKRDITVSDKAVRRLAERAPDAELHSYDTDHFAPFDQTWPPVIAADQVAFLRARGLLGA